MPASLLSVPSHCLPSWLAPSTDPGSVWDTLKWSQLSRGDDPAADTRSAHNDSLSRRQLGGKDACVARRHNSAEAPCVSVCDKSVGRGLVSDKWCFVTGRGERCGVSDPGPWFKFVFLIMRWNSGCRSVCGPSGRMRAAWRYLFQLSVFNRRPWIIDWQTEVCVFTICLCWLVENITAVSQLVRRVLSCDV